MAENRLKFLRQMAGFDKAKDFARAAGLSATHVSNLESGRVKFTEESIEAICKLLKVTEKELFEGEKKYPKHDPSRVELTGFEGIPEAVLEENFKTAAKHLLEAAREERLPLADNIRRLCLEISRRDELAASLKFASAQEGSLKKGVDLVLNERPGLPPSRATGVPSGRTSPPKRGSEQHSSSRRVPEEEAQVEPKASEE